jgi:hypothetical protein
MPDQAETLRRMMAGTSSPSDASRFHGGITLSLFLTPSVREKRLFSPRALSLYARECEIPIRIRDGGKGDSQEAVGDELLILGTEERDLLAAYSRLKEHANRRGVKGLNILVCGTLSDVDAAALYECLSEASRRFLGGAPGFVGVFRAGEKFRESLAIREFLLHCQSRACECPKGQEASAV